MIPEIIEMLCLLLICNIVEIILLGVYAIAFITYKEEKNDSRNDRPAR